MGKRSAGSISNSPWTLAALFLCLLMAGGAAEAKRPKLPRESRRTDTREIERMEEQWRTAVVAGDAAVIDKLLSDDFLAISARGTLSDKQQYLHRIATHATQFRQFDLLDMKVRISTGAAVAVSQAHISGMLESRPIEGTFRYTKVYSRVGGAWRMTNFEATRVSAPPADTGDMNQGTPLAGRSSLPPNP